MGSNHSVDRVTVAIDKVAIANTNMAIPTPNTEAVSMANKLQELNVAESVSVVIDKPDVSKQKHAEYNQLAKVCNLPKVDEHNDYHVNKLNRMLWCARFQNHPSMWNGQVATKSYCGHWRKSQPNPITGLDWDLNYQIKHIAGEYDHSDPKQKTSCANCAWAYLLARSEIHPTEEIIGVMTSAGSDTATIETSGAPQITTVVLPKSTSNVLVSPPTTNTKNIEIEAESIIETEIPIPKNAAIRLPKSNDNFAATRHSDTNVRLKFKVWKKFGVPMSANATNVRIEPYVHGSDVLTIHSSNPNGTRQISLANPKPKSTTDSTTPNN